MNAMTHPSAPGIGDTHVPHAPHVLGIDIGGTKLAVGVSNAAGELLVTDRIPSNSGEPSELTLARLIEVSRRAIDKAAVTVAAAGVGCVGPLDQKTGYVINPVNLRGWKHVPLVDTLRDALRIPVFLDNDANAAALGEHRFGAGKGVANMVYLTVSTGIGGGIIVGHRLYQGENGNAGELGHMSVHFAGRPCGCGNLGCIETYASGTAIALRAREAVMAGADSLMPALAGEIAKIDAPVVVEAVRRGDALANRIWDETIVALGSCLTSVIHAFNPHRIVIGGGMSNAGDLLFVPLRAQTKKHAMPMLYDACEIVPAQLGDQVGVLGAVAVGLDGFGHSRIKEAS
jgi:glucokinase